MKKYILKKSFHSDRDNFSYGELSGSSVIGKESFYNKFTSTTLYNGNCKFQYMMPFLSGEFDDREIVIADCYSLEGGPESARLSVVSKKMKGILEQYNLPPHRFFEGSILHEEEFLPFYACQLLYSSFEKYIDYNHSEFNFLRRGEIIEGGVRNTYTSIEDLMISLEKKHDLFLKWEFQEAIMKPKFRDIDLCRNPLIGGSFIISERLKKALEEANLEGIEIKECPIDFKYSDEL